MILWKASTVHSISLLNQWKEKPHKRSCAFKFPSLPTKKKKDPSSRRVGVGSENHKYYAKIDVLKEEEHNIIEEYAQIDDEAIYDVPPVNMITMLMLTIIALVLPGA